MSGTARQTHFTIGITCSGLLPHDIYNSCQSLATSESPRRGILITVSCPVSPRAEPGSLALNMCPTVPGLALPHVHARKCSTGHAPSCLATVIQEQSYYTRTSNNSMILSLLRPTPVMVFYPSILTLLLLQLPSATARTFTVVNECPYTVWHVPAHLCYPLAPHTEVF